MTGAWATLTAVPQTPLTPALGSRTPRRGNRPDPQAAEQPTSRVRRPQARSVQPRRRKSKLTLPTVSDLHKPALLPPRPPALSPLKAVPQLLGSNLTVSNCSYELRTALCIGPSFSNLPCDWSESQGRGFGPAAGVGAGSRLLTGSPASCSGGSRGGVSRSPA